MRLSDEKIFFGQTLSAEPGKTVRFDNQPIETVHTLVARPGQKIIKEISKISSLLRIKYPQYYYYSPSQLHFTIIGYTSANHDAEKFIQMAREEFVKFHLDVTYKGVQINNQSVFIGVYCRNNALQNFRKALRQNDPSLIDYDSFLPRLSKVGWLNIARFTKSFDEELRQFSLSKQEQVFGSTTVTQLEFYLTSSKVLEKDRSKLVTNIN